MMSLPIGLMGFIFAQLHFMKWYRNGETVRLVRTAAVECSNTLWLRRHAVKGKGKRGFV